MNLLFPVREQPRPVVADVAPARRRPSERRGAQLALPAPRPPLRADTIGTVEGEPVFLRRIPDEGNAIGLVCADGSIIQSMDPRFCTDEAAERTLRTWLDR